MEWNRAALNEVAEIITGTTPPMNDASNYGGKIPFVTPAYLDSREPISTTETKISSRGIVPKRLLPVQSVLVSCIGSLGKVGIAGVPLMTNQQINALVFDDTKVDPLYGYYYCRTLKPILENMAPATTLPIVNKSRFAELTIPLPPLPEQKCIAAILDEADALRRKRREAIATLDTLLQSVFLEMFGDPVTNPRGWSIAKIGDILARIDSGWSPKCEERPARSSEWGVLKLGAVTKCEFLATENKALPTLLSPDISIEVHAGDVLFSRKNTYDLVAACAYVHDVRPRLMLSDLIFRLVISPNAKVLPQYIWKTLTYPAKRKQIQTLAGGSAGSMPNISKERLKTATIPIPPFRLQEEFASRVTEIYVMRKQAQASLSRLNALFSTLQDQSFNRRSNIETPKTPQIQPCLTLDF